MTDITRYTEQLQEYTQQLTAPGAPFELTEHLSSGVPIRCYRNAPPTLREAISQGRQYGEKTFVTYEDDRWSFDQFFAQVDALAHFLHQDLAVERGHRVAIAMRNYPEWMAAFAAIVSIGAVAVPLNSWGSAEELEYALDDAGAKIVCCDEVRAGLLQPRLAAGTIHAVVARATSLPADNCTHWAQAIEGGRELPDVSLSPGDMAMIMYTSGTTGRSKGAASTHFAICQALYNFEFMATVSAMLNPEAIGHMLNAGFDPSTLLAVPLFHVSGCYSVFLLNLRGGRKTSIMYKWDVSDALRIIERERITTFTGVPTMTMAMMSSPEWDQYDHQSLFAIGAGGTASPPHLKDMIYGKLPHAYPGTGYGMTETNATCCSFTGEAYKLCPTSSGNLSPIVEVKTVDTDGRDLAKGATGEIYVRSPTNAQQYWNNAEASASTFIEGWVATGDVGYIDEHGFLFIVDRIKDMVIRGGENIYPIEVEGILLGHAAVAEAAVFGIPHDSWGEELVAVIHSTDPTLSGDNLASWTKEHLAAFKVPSQWRLSREPLPKNATGKVLKAQLRGQWLAEG